ncbi:unnamed protein product [Allacma fusca]|uniref:Uncharacterized protein n=1 Tax=Allacma fusca TaxID=39272 RepID=A0A8J2LPW9_9HEXA|nr:unnamed protein product [Allacma fusca]
MENDHGLLSTWMPTTFGRLADVRRVSIRPATDPADGESLSLHSIHGRHVHGRPKPTKVGHHRIGTGLIKAEYESFDDFIKRQSRLKQSNDVFSHGQEENLKTNNESESVEETSKRTRYQRVAPKYPKKFYPGNYYQ